MRHIRPVHLVVAALLVLAIGGTSATAASLVTSKQIKNNSIKSADIKNRTLTRKDIKTSTLRGLRGSQGPQGPQGPAGPTAVNKLVRVEAAGAVVPGDIDGPTAQCPAGHGLVSGGYITAGAGDGVFTSDSFGGNSWSVGYDNYDSTVTADVTAVAYCAPKGAAVSPQRVAPREGTDAPAAFEALLRKQRALHAK